jgi:predicted DNA-binding transcriptional regulator AlpA
LRPALLGEPDFKKVAGENALAERHAVIARAKEEHPEMPLEKLCELMGVSRSWYYEKHSSRAPSRRPTARRMSGSETP